MKNFNAFKRVLITLIIILGTLWIFSFPTNGQSELKYKQYIIGKSVNGIPIVLHEINNGDRIAMYFAGIHGNEAAGVSILNQLIQYYKDNPETCKGWTVRIIPNINPDGVKAKTRCNAHHVDLNRNFPCNHKDGPSDANYLCPCKTCTTGTIINNLPSEPEAKALRLAVLGQPPAPSNRPDRILTIHQLAPSEEIPSDFVKLDPDPSYESMSVLVDAMIKALDKHVKYEDMLTGGGSFGQWVASNPHLAPIPTITYELAASSHKKNEENWKRNLPALLAFLINN